VKKSGGPRRRDIDEVGDGILEKHGLQVLWLYLKKIKMNLLANSKGGHPPGWDLHVQERGG